MFKYNLELNESTISFQIIEVDEKMRGMDIFEASNGVRIMSEDTPMLIDIDIYIIGKDIEADRSKDHLQLINPAIAKAYYESYQVALDELAEKYKNAWKYERCLGMIYYYINTGGEVIKGVDHSARVDLIQFSNLNYFITNHFTKEQLISDHVPQMSRKQRMCYIKHKGDCINCPNNVLCADCAKELKEI